MLNKKSFFNRIFGNQNNSKFKERKARRLSLENLEVRALLSVSPYTLPSQNNEDDTATAIVEPLVDSHRQVTFDDTLQVDFSTQSQLDNTATNPQLETVPAAVAAAETEVTLPVEVEAQASNGGQTELVSLESQIRTPNILSATSSHPNKINITIDYRANAGEYRILYSSDGGATWISGGAIEQTSGSNPTGTITGLTANTTYLVRVRALRQENDTTHTNSEWSSPVSVTTAEKIGPLDPTVSTTNITQRTATIYWDAVSYAGKYVLKITTTPLSATDDWNSISATVTEETSYNYSNLTPGTTYFVLFHWYPSESASGTYKHSNGCVISFTTIATLPTPTLTSAYPCNDINASMSVSFTAVANAGAYRIKYRPVDESEDAQIITINTTSVTISHLIPGKRYNVWVQAISSNTSLYDNSEWSTNKTTSYLIKQQLKTPSNLKSTGTTESSVSLSWDNVSNASSFLVEYSTSSDFANSSTSVFSSNSGTVSSLASGTTYYFRVKSVGIDYYVNSDYSSAVTATTPILVKSVSLSTNTPLVCDTITASVNPTNATCTYQWSYDISPTGTFTNITGATSATFETYAGLIGKYLRCTITGTGDYTGTVTATTTEPVKSHPVLPIFVNDTPSLIGSNTIHLEFTYQADIGSYCVQYSSDDGATWSSSIIVEQTTGSNPVCDIKNLPEGTYKIRVRLIIKDGDVEPVNSEWYETDYVIIDKLDVPELNELKVDSTTVSVLWSEVDNASGYQLEYKLSTATATEWEKIKVTDTSATFTGAEGATYDVRVKALGTSDDFDSEYSEIKSVTIPELTNQIQQVYSNNVNAIVGSKVTIPVYYDVMNGNTNLTGLGLRVHYDSSKLQFEGYSDCLETSNTRMPTNDTDDDNDDGSTTTDKVIRIDWLDMTASPAWPSVETPVLLVNLTFTVKAEDADTTVINYTGDGAYTVEGTSTEINIIKGNFDIDGNGKLEPLKDGLLLYRYLSKFKGNTLTQYAIGKNATRTTADEVTAYLDSIKSILDIDGNGKLEPLKDGLLLYRYLSKFKGDTLTQYAIGKNATRTTADEISEYIASFSTIQSSAAEVAPTTMLDSSKVSMEVPTTVTVLETPVTQVESKMVEQKSEPVNVQTELTAKDSTSVLASATLQATDSIFDGWDEFTQEDDDSIDFVIESELKTVLK